MAYGCAKRLECGGSSHRFSVNSQRSFIGTTITKKRYRILLCSCPFPVKDTTGARSLLPPYFKTAVTTGAKPTKA